MNEEEVLENKPVENTESDDDFFGEIDKEVIEEQENQNSEEGSDNQESEPNGTDDEDDSEEKGVDFKPFLDELSKKVKYNKEPVNVENIDDVITNYQKGLNYDKLQEKFDNLQNSRAETYIANKAKELGLTVDEYITEVENYEKAQQKEKEEARMKELQEQYGLPQDLAEEIIATSQLRKELEAKKAEEKEKEEANRKEKEKDKQFIDFLETYPNVKAEDIPEEVWVKSQKTSLREAYTEWKLAEVEKQLAIKKQNEENSNSSVGAVTDTGTVQEKKDLFLEGFESD